MDNMSALSNSFDNEHFGPGQGLAPSNSQLGEHAPAYRVLLSRNLLVTKYRKDTFEDLFIEGDLEPNSSHAENFQKRWKWGVYWTPGCGLIVYSMFNKEVVVPPGHVCCFIDQNDEHLFAKPGIHNIEDPFIKRRGNPIPLFGQNNYRNIIEHGDRCCLTVPHGMIGYATDMGRPMLLPPGLHSWKSETIRFEKMYRLDDSPIISVGPYTLLTVDEGYIAITTDNGKQVLLDGGMTHLLTHSKWKFEQFINMKIQTEDLRGVNVSTADNILMSIDATIVWKIQDAEKAAIMVTETMVRSDHSILANLTDDDMDVGSLSKLRRDVLKQTLAAVARFVGAVNYADYFHYINSINSTRPRPKKGDFSMDGSRGRVSPSGGGFMVRKGSEGDVSGISNQGSVPVSLGMSQLSLSTVENPMFNLEGLADAMSTAREVMREFGVEIMGVSIISAHPVDQTLRNSLSTSAVASAEALKVEARARGLARAVEIEAEAASITTSINAEAEAKAVLTKAKAEAQAEILRSDGSKEAQILRAVGDKEVSKLSNIKAPLSPSRMNFN